MSYFSMYALVTRTSYFQNRIYDFIVCNFVKNIHPRFLTALRSVIFLWKGEMNEVLMRFVNEFSTWKTFFSRFLPNKLSLIVDRLFQLYEYVPCSLNGQIVFTVK